MNDTLMKRILTIFDVEPLNVFPISHAQILESVLHIGLPCDIRIVHNVVLAGRVGDRSEFIGEEAFGDESARVSCCIRFKFFATHGRSAIIQIFVQLNWIAIINIVDTQVVSHELLVGAGLDEAAMVLIEVVQLVVHIDGSLDVIFNLKLDDTLSTPKLALRIVLM